MYSKFRGIFLLLPFFLLADPSPSVESVPIAVQPKVQPSSPVNPYQIFKESKLECAGVFFFADFLYWKATSELPFAELGDLFDIPSVATLSLNGKIQNVRFHYEPAFRIGGGFFFERGWDIKCDWLHFLTSNSKSLTATDDTVINLLWAFLPLFPTITDVKAHQTIQIDQVQLDFVKRIGFGTHFFLDAIFGAMGAWIDQSMTTNTHFFDAASEPAQTTYLKNHFRGGGLQFGFASEYAPIRYFGIYGEGRFSLAYGKFSLTCDEQFTSLFPGFENITSNERENQRAVVSSFDIRAGVKGAYRFNDCFELSGHVSYEFSYWPNFVRNRNAFSNIPPNGQTFAILGFGDLGFQGITAGLSTLF